MIISKKVVALFLFESIMLAGIFDLIYIISKGFNPYTTIETFFVGVGIAAGQRLFQYIKAKYKSKQLTTKKEPQ